MANLRPNRVKRKIQNGETATVLIGPQTTDMVDLLGPLGFDAIWLEAEHGPADFADIPDLSRACDLWEMTPLVRVNMNLEALIYRSLDSGAQGIIVPHVNTAEEAKAVVDGAKYHPVGRRSIFPGRQGHGIDDYYATINDETVVVVLIEDIRAINNLAEILKIDHIDVFFVAPADLAQSMGFPPDFQHPEVQATVDRAIAQIQDAGRVPGTLVNETNVQSYIEKGVRFTLLSWQPWFTAGAQAFLDQVAASSKR